MQMKSKILDITFSFDTDKGKIYVSWNPHDYTVIEAMQSVYTLKENVININTNYDLNQMECDWMYHQLAPTTWPFERFNYSKLNSCQCHLKFLNLWTILEII